MPEIGARTIRDRAERAGTARHRPARQRDRLGHCGEQVVACRIPAATGPVAWTRERPICAPCRLQKLPC